MSARIFIRNDDVWTLDSRFRFFFDSAIDRGIPVVHAVIPGKMDQGLIRFLCRAKEKTPHLLDIVQHGWMHTNHSADAGLKYEFGASRDYRSQYADIQQGQEKMRLAFGKYFTPAFVPPYHGYDQNTLHILEQKNFQLFSAGNHRLKIKQRFLEMPAQISFSRYEKQGRKSVENARHIIAALARSISRKPVAGVVTHHADFKNLVYRRELTRFFDYLAALEVKEQWKVLLFSEILNA